jgi:thermitase
MGVAGVAYSAGLINGKVFDDTGGSSLSQLISGINWAANYGARVINMSMGSTGQGTFDDCNPSWYEDLFDAGVNELQDAINDAWSKGTVVVSTVGNKGNSFQQWPCACPNVLTVANTMFDDTRAADSSFGTWVEVAAPGTGIVSTLPGGGFGNKSGTSMAAPHVAGLAALAKSSCGLPATAQAVVNRPGPRHQLRCWYGQRLLRAIHTRNGGNAKRAAIRELEVRRRLEVRRAVACRTP